MMQDCQQHSASRLRGMLRNLPLARRLPELAILVLLSILPLAGQNQRITVSGVVRDRGGAVLADVEVSTSAGGSRQVLKTDASGEFAFEALPPAAGTLHVAAT